MPSPAPAPVFVDDTGRRHRFVRGFGWALAAVVTVYLALLGVSLVGSPGLVPLSLPAVGQVLPGPAAPLLSDGSNAGRSAGELVPTAAGTPAPVSTWVTSAASRAVGQHARTRTATRSSTGSSPAPRPTATATPAPTRTSQGKGTPAATSPRPSKAPTAHPTPHSTHGRHAATIASPSALPRATP